MDGAYNISDPSDWLETSLTAFSPLENALRCQVCKDFYATPMITSCSHTFCSLCIRRCLSNDGKCPTCRAADQASKLRRNWSIEEVVGAFQSARPTAFEIAKKDKEEIDDEAKRPGKRRRIAHEDHQDNPSRRSTRQTRSSARNMTNHAQTQDAIEIQDSDAEYEPEDGLAACPICHTRMKAEAVFAHLDNCDGTKQDTSRQASRTPATSTRQSDPPSRPSSAKPQERLAELNYSLLKENALKKKLQELGIPSTGSKPLLIRRHTEWANIWNANCDSSHPKIKRELLAELDKWERSQGGMSREQDSAIMKKDFDSAGWATNNKDDFSRLIAEARKKKEKASKPSEEKAAEVDASEKQQADDLEEIAHVNSTTQPAAPSLQKQGSNAYEDNPDAMSSIRAKVDAANAGEHIEPIMNKDYHETADNEQNISMFDGIREQPESTKPAPPPVAPRLEKEASLPEHFGGGPTKKLPMFEVPGRPVEDIDSHQAGI